MYANAIVNVCLWAAARSACAVVRVGRWRRAQQFPMPFGIIVVCAYGWRHDALGERIMA